MLRLMNCRTVSAKFKFYSFLHPAFKSINKQNVMYMKIILDDYKKSSDFIAISNPLTTDFNSCLNKLKDYINLKMNAVMAKQQLQPDAKQYGV